MGWLELRWAGKGGNSSEGRGDCGGSIEYGEKAMFTSRHESSPKQHGHACGASTWMPWHCSGDPVVACWKASISFAWTYER